MRSSCRFSPIPKKFCGCLIAMALACAAAAVQAQPVQTPSLGGDHVDGHAGGLGLRAGYNSDYRKLALIYETPTWWSYQSQDGWGRLDLGAELGVSYWEARHGSPDSMWQLSAIPMLRWWPSDYFYAEIGVGATVLSRTHFADRDLSTAYQFGNHIGVGTVIADAHRIGLRYSHFSNAGIKKPNPGLDVLQLTYTYQF